VASANRCSTQVFIHMRNHSIGQGADAHTAGAAQAAQPSPETATHRFHPSRLSRSVLNVACDILCLCYTCTWGGVMDESTLSCMLQVTRHAVQPPQSDVTALLHSIACQHPCSPLPRPLPINPAPLPAAAMPPGPGGVAGGRLPGINPGSPEAPPAPAPPAPPIARPPEPCGGTRARGMPGRAAGSRGCRSDTRSVVCERE
jgi:hypothetical protein